MKIEYPRRIGFHELDQGFSLRLKPLLNYMQEAAALHSDRAGYANPQLLNIGRAWVLHRMVIQIHRLPALGDELRVVTWHRGGRGVRSYRDFEIYAAGEKVVSAGSLWLFIDTVKKKILKVPGDVSEKYEMEEEEALAVDIDKWRPNFSFEPANAVSIPVRPSDYDPLGHVNNAVYFDYVEILMERLLHRPEKKGMLFMQYSNEIQQEIEVLWGELKSKKGGFIFRLVSTGGTHAVGEFVWG